MSEDRLIDRQAIADLMTGWLYRDTMRWDELADLFHEDATIEITWFRGAARDFIDGSRRMAAGPLRTKHVIGAPVIRFAGDRALVETNAMIVADHLDLGLGVTTHNRFLDRVSQRDGVWRITHRDAVYDMGGFTYPFGTQGAADIDTDALTRHPREYAALAYVLEHSGFPVTGTFPTRGSEREQEIMRLGTTWLAGQEESA